MTSRAAGWEAAIRRTDASWEALAAALCLPLLFLEVQWQPGFSVGLGTATASIHISDLAVVAIAAFAVVAGARRGFAPLRHGRAIWLTAGALLVWILVEVALGRARTPAYPWHDHALSAVKYVEYALLAPAVPLLARRRADLAALLWSLVLWSTVATAVGVAQFAGAPIVGHANAGSRQPSFLSDSDFAALSSAALLVGIVALTVTRLRLGRALGATGVLAGLAGMLVAAAVASALGVATAAILLAALLLVRDELGRRRAFWGAVVAAAAIGGVVAYRGGDIGSFARFLGVSSGGAQRERTVQTYAHHALLAWIGIQIWQDHKVLGAGWDASEDPSTFEPYLAAAHRRFPNEPPAAFPSRTRTYGVQNTWVQALADLGLVGLALLVAAFATAGRAAWRRARAGEAAPTLALVLLPLVAWLCVAQGFVAGIPLDAVVWLAFGLAAIGVARREAS